MTSLEDISADDIAEALDTVESLETQVDSLEDELDIAVTEDDFNALEPTEAQEIADRTFMERLDHLVNEDCDTEKCNEIRNQFDIDPGTQDSHDHDEGTETETETDDDEGTETENADEGDDSDGLNDVEWDEGEDIFGDPV